MKEYIYRGRVPTHTCIHIYAWHTCIHIYLHTHMHAYIYVSWCVYESCTSIYRYVPLKSVWFGAAPIIKIRAMTGYVAFLSWPPQYWLTAVRAYVSCVCTHVCADICMHACTIERSECVTWNGMSINAFIWKNIISVWDNNIHVYV